MKKQKTKLARAVPALEVLPPVHLSPIAQVGHQFSRILQPDRLGGGIKLKSCDDHPHQKLMVESQCLRIIVRAGRRGGKTVGASIKAVRSFLAGMRVLYAAPTTEQHERFWKEVSAALDEPVMAGIYRKNESEHFIELPKTEQRIKAKTAWNADTLRGDYADLLILDEFQLVNEDAWRLVGAPMLIENNGSAVFIYTPPSLSTKAITKAKDVRYASKLFKAAEDEMKLAAEQGRESRWLAIHWGSAENPFVSREGIAEVSRDMTALGIRQEILAEDTDEVPGALWKLSMIDDTRVSESQVPDLERIAVGIDPTGSTGNEAGIVCSGRGPAPRGWEPSPDILARCKDVMTLRHIYILADNSKPNATPRTWGQAAVNLYFERKADRMYGERNYGGDMVESTIRQAEGGQSVAYSDANATRGKVVRAQPVVAGYERGIVHHVGVFPELEAEMCSYVEGNPSPNRMDALVWSTLPLIEGDAALGLLRYYAEGKAQAELESITKRERGVANGDSKPNGNGHAELRACPECQSVQLQDVPGGQVRCQSCGVQFWPNGKRPSVHQVTRAAYDRGDYVGQRR